MNVIKEVRKLVSEETFNNLRDELVSIEDWEYVYQLIIEALEEEE